MRATVWLVLAALAGCTPEAGPTAAAPDPDPPRPPPSAEAPPPARVPVALLNTADELYRLDPSTLDVTRLGAFWFRDGGSVPITDLAVDRRGRMWALGFEAVYRVDPDTFECILLARYPGRQLNALAVVPATMLERDPEIPDLLLAAEAFRSTVYSVDPDTGELAPVGDLGPGLASSGDLTWAPGAGLVMVTIDSKGREAISTLAAKTFAASPIGAPWTFQRVRALTLAGRILVGADETGDLIEIDTTTGDAKLRRTVAHRFYGGAVGWTAK